ncbi:MAG: TonB-dependent receptor [Thermodesulfovibrionales bacterium]|nr:TonB-dependent receptor [Thermodesulfovibrionales bacterium]
MRSCISSIFGRLYINIFLTILLAVLLFCPGAEAQSRQELQAQQEGIIITATRTEAPVEQVAASVLVITREEIDLLAATTVLEVLEGVPGIMLFDLYGNGAAASVDFRGFTSGRHTAVLVDGRKVNRPGGASVDWNLIPLANVERIEIVRGGSAGVLYGDSATSAVINIITRGAMAGYGVWSLDGRYGSSGDKAGSISVGGQDGRMLYYIYGSMDQMDGHRDNSGREGRDMNIRLTDNFMDNYYFGLEYIYHDDEQMLSGPLSGRQLVKDRDASRWLDVNADYEVSSYGFTLGQTMGGEMLIEAQYYIEEVQGAYDDAALTESDVLLTTRTALKLVYADDQHSFTMGTDIIDHDGEIQSDAPSSGIDTTWNYDRIETGYYMNENFIFSESMVFSGGYRETEMEYDLSLTGNDGSGNLDESKTMQLEESSYNVGASFIYSAGSKFYTNYTRGYRFPTSDEAFGFSGDPEPEKSETMEGGIVHGLEGGTSFRATYFETEVEDEMISDSSGITQESTERKGVELGMGYAVAEGMKLDLNYVYLDAEITSGEYTNRQIPLVPQQTVSGSFSARMSSFTFVFMGRWVDNRRVAGDLKGDQPSLSEYMTLNGKMGYGFEGGAFYIGVHNILDEEFEAYAERDSGGNDYYSAAGRRYYAGLRMAL